VKIRKGADGLHLFDRTTGLNILLDEVNTPGFLQSRAPRFVSFALTNLCNLHCSFCYAPKEPASLGLEQVMQWAVELDSNGCLAIGFGGGEPTLYPRFSELCNRVAYGTKLGVSFTTHAHQMTAQLRNELGSAVHFIRVSMDGVHRTYERIRGRPFDRLLEQLRIVADICPFGINYVVNDDTVGELDQAADVVQTVGATELLLLPELSRPGFSDSACRSLARWISDNSNRIRLSISENTPIDGVPIANPFVLERGTRAYVHVNAFGMLSRSSYQKQDAIPIEPNRGVLDAIAKYEGAV
jgi:MoaA/NifB/PqqE/SkfB family radical SAM enzyme